ncbi:MAG: preprotein translocase subunit SecE [Anaerolineales bacterium]|nr:preprotein translocase subunit SecE [Anaerolineales bacterium]
MARIRTRTVEDERTEQKSAAVSTRRRRKSTETAENNQVSQRKDRPTPSARDLKPRGTGSTGLVNRIPVVRGIVAYFRGVAAELQKVTWPSREETTRLTSVVLGVTIAFAIGLGILDGFFGWWFQQAFHADSEWIFLAIAAGLAVLVSGTYFTFRHRI